MKNLRHLIGMMLAILMIQEGFSQDVKREFERPISRDEVAEEIINQLRPILNGASKIKFYREYDGESYTIEAKLKYKGNYWSIEFEADGKFKDAELYLNRKKFKQIMDERFQASFKSLGKKFTITRVQKQFSWQTYIGNQAFDIAVLNEGNKSVQVMYELELEVVTMDSHIEDMELLMTPTGEIVRKRKIEVLLPEHLLY